MIQNIDLGAGKKGDGDGKQMSVEGHVQQMAAESSPPRAGVLDPKRE